MKTCKRTEVCKWIIAQAHALRDYKPLQGVTEDEAQAHRQRTVQQAAAKHLKRLLDHKLFRWMHRNRLVIHSK